MEELSLSDAESLARQYLAARFPDQASEIVLLKDETRATAFGWVFFYQSRKYLESGDVADAFFGNAPLIVDKRKHEVWPTGSSAPVERYIDNYEAYGHPDPGASSNDPILSHLRGRGKV